jgi:GNAT superfamily N-acetyltransferase
MIRISPLDPLLAPYLEKHLCYRRGEMRTWILTSNLLKDKSRLKYGRLIGVTAFLPSGKRPIGWAAAWKGCDRARCFRVGIFVNPHYRHRQVGHRLVRELHKLVQGDARFRKLPARWAPAASRLVIPVFVGGKIG